MRDESDAGPFLSALAIILLIVTVVGFIVFILPMIEAYGYVKGWWSP